MFSRILVCLFSLFSTVLSAHPLVDFLCAQHLDTPDGRVAFLEQKLTPYLSKVMELQETIESLTAEANVLSPEHDQAKILEIAQKVTEETGKLVALLPILEQCLYIEEDFLEIDQILQNPDSVSPEQEEVLKRLERICLAVN